jgi:hypothetical protein
MDYNWPEILKKKSTFELYGIYCGKSGLPSYIISFAKKELEERNFDFKDTKDMVFEQRYDELAAEATKLTLYLQKNPYLSLKFNLIGILIMLIPVFLYFGFNGVPFIIPIIISAIAIPCMLVSTAISNAIRKKKIIRLEKLEKELRSLIEEQNRNVADYENKLSISEFNNEVRSGVLANLKWNRNMTYIAVIVFIAILLIKFLMKRFGI